MCVHMCFVCRQIFECFAVEAAARRQYIYMLSLKNGIVVRSHNVCKCVAHILPAVLYGVLKMVYGMSSLNVADPRPTRRTRAQCVHLCSDYWVRILVCVLWKNLILDVLRRNSALAHSSRDFRNSAQSIRHTAHTYTIPCVQMLFVRCVPCARLYICEWWC